MGSPVDDHCGPFNPTWNFVPLFRLSVPVLNIQILNVGHCCSAFKLAAEVAMGPNRHVCPSQQDGTHAATVHVRCVTRNACFASQTLARRLKPHTRGGTTPAFFGSV